MAANRRKCAGALGSVIALVAALSGLVLVRPAAAAVSTLYVNKGSASCSDSGSGTAAQPYCTIIKAATVAVAGQTVLVSSGNYAGGITVAKSGTAGAPIVFQPAPGAAVTVTGGSSGFKVSSKSYITIMGFTVTQTTARGIYLTGDSNITVQGNNVSFAGEPTSGSTAAGIKLDDTTASLVVGNTTHHNSDHGISVGSSSGNSIRGNLSYSNAREISRAAAGIYLSSSPSNVIDSNTSQNNEDSGISLWNGSNNSIVTNNVTANNGDHGIDDLSSTGLSIVSNTVYRSVDSGIEMQGSAGANLVNNVVVDNGINSPRTAGNIRVVDSGSAANTTLDYDLVFLSSDTDLIDYLGKAYTSLAAFQAATGKETHGKQGDPKFVSAAAGNLHIGAGSAAIDSANASAANQPSVDHDGIGRVDDPGTANTGVGVRAYDDRGAYEFVPSGGNQPPVATNDAASTVAGSPVTVSVLANDSDGNGDALTVTATSTPAHGAAVVNANGTVTYTPAAGYAGADSFTYTISDGRGGSATATVSISVAAANRAPVAANDIASTVAGSPVTVSVLANDSDPDGDALTVTAASTPAHGAAVVNANGTVTYTPAAGYSGADSFTYTISDGRGGPATATVSISVAAANRAPVANGDSASTGLSTPVTVAVLTNDTDPDGDPLTVTNASTPAHGTAVVNANGTITYTPVLLYVGADSFTYTISDGRGATATATVSISVTALNASPVAQDDAATTAQGTAKAVAVLANDSDPDGDPLTVTAASTPAHGAAVVNADNTVTYTPAAGYVGADSFTYTISDGRGGTATATVSMTVTQGNRLPVATNDAASTAQGAAVSVPVLANDSDPDGDALTVTAASTPAHGAAVVNANGTVTYTPAAGYSGADSFTYTISDGRGGTATATVSVAVSRGNALPVATSDATSTAQGVAVTVPVLANDSDPDGDALTVTAASTPAHGAAVVNATGTVTYTPAAGYVGPDSFTYTISDGHGGTATGTVSVTVTAANLVGNPGFETNTSGWQAGASSTTLTRVAGGHTGGFAAQLSNSTSGATCELDDKPSWVGVTQSGPYAISMWIRSDTAGRSLKLRIREYKAGSQVGSVSISATTTTAWQQVTAVYTPTAPGQSSLKFEAYTSSSPVGVCFLADDISITH